MLVLTRKQKESIKIGDSIVITILRVQGQSVRVVRGELSASKPEESSEAATETETQIIDFRFTPEQPASDSNPRPARGPLASLMATLHTQGFVAEAAAK